MIVLYFICMQTRSLMVVLHSHRKHTNSCVHFCLQQKLIPFWIVTRSLCLHQSANGTIGLDFFFESEPHSIKVHIRYKIHLHSHSIWWKEINKPTKNKHTRTRIPKAISFNHTNHSLFVFIFHQRRTRLTGSFVTTFFCLFAMSFFFYLLSEWMKDTLFICVFVVAKSHLMLILWSRVLNVV